jgi:hypothetical protein
MSKIKNWQCPYCRHAASRRGNLVDHIRAIHRVDGQPIDKRNSCGSRNTSFSNLDGTHSDRRPSPSPYNFNRSSINHSNQGSKDKGDMIDDMHQMLTELEKKRRKVEEINEILRKYSLIPFPIQTPYTYVSNPATKDKEKIEPPNIPHQDKPYSYEAPIQTHNYKIEIPSQKTKTENAPQHIPVGQNKETNRWSIRTEYLVDPDGEKWDVNVPPKITWVCKRNFLGEIIDMYKAFEDPYDELREDAKRCWKSFILHQ